MWLSSPCSAARRRSRVLKQRRAAGEGGGGIVGSYLEHPRPPRLHIKYDRPESAAPATGLVLIVKRYILGRAVTRAWRRWGSGGWGSLPSPHALHIPRPDTCSCLMVQTAACLADSGRWKRAAQPGYKPRAALLKYYYMWQGGTLCPEAPLRGSSLGCRGCTPPCWYLPMRLRGARVARLVEFPQEPHRLVRQ